eukprot:gene18061-18298_t
MTAPMARPGDQLKPLTDLSASPAADRGPAPSADAIRNGLYVDRIGKTFGARRARLGVGYLPQEASIFRGMSVAENVLAVVEMHEPDPAKAQRTVTRLLDELRISHLKASPASSLSGGERRRCEIARALAMEPAFILLDEPFAGIDPLAINDIRDVIGYLKAKGIGVLITDHNVRETLEIIDRASIIHGGEVLFEGSPDAVLADPEVRRVYLGDRFN